MLKFGKKDIYIAAAVLPAAFLLFLWQHFQAAPDEAAVLVERNGAVIGSYPLSGEERLILTDDAGRRNVLVIQGGRAYMEEADCPDRLCVKQKAVSKNGESIICLPHRLVIRIAGGMDGETDVIVGKVMDSDA